MQILYVSLLFLGLLLIFVFCLFFAFCAWFQNFNLQNQFEKRVPVSPSGLGLGRKVQI